MTTRRGWRRAWCAASLVAACSGSQHRYGDSPAPRPLEEVRAERVIADALRSQGVGAELRRRIRVTGRREVECDFTLAGTRHGIEYMSAGDRALLGSAIPTRARPDALRVIPGVEGDQGADLLLLDDQDYVYEPDAERAGPDHPTVDEVEDRLRRVIVDYVAWLRANGRM